ncbi:hypothetical protein [Chitinophaga sp.]|uniref:hypothetical protein n=1 Tax=Chitinophaga sp. TaxID=1869181 RepID=UPI0031D341D8
MLPVKIGDKKLSEDVLLKLESFYQQFCTGENRKRYGLAHIVYACHASFPLLLSPALANLIRLNFNTYISGGEVQQIDPVVVSDFLLSSLVRPVGYRQYEVMPEIRSYFLYLLKDGRWFELFEIKLEGERRLHSLARFLLEYVKDGTSFPENDTTGFRQLNAWAAKAYLHPNELAFELAKSLNDSLGRGDEKRENEWGQLRINMLTERFKQQLDLDIYDTNSTGKQLFINFSLYNQVNILKLAGKPADEAFEHFNQFDTHLITDGTDDTGITLPLQEEIVQQLFTRKKVKTRVYTLVIKVDEGIEAINTAHGMLIHHIRIALGEIGRFHDYQVVEVTQMHREVLEAEPLIEAIGSLFRQTRNEDMVLICILGARGSMEREEGIKMKDGNILYSHEFRELFVKAKGNSNAQVVIIMDTPDVGKALWVGDYDIQISFPGLSAVNNRPLNWIFNYLFQNGGAITYRDILRLARHKTGFRGGINMHVPPEYWNNYFLSKSTYAFANDGYLVVAGNENSWSVLDDDFKVPVLSTTTKAHYYTSFEEIPGVSGELFTRYDANTLLFAGDSKRLDKSRIYKVVPEKRALKVECIFGEVAERNEFYRALKSRKINAFSRWEQFLFPEDDFHKYPSTDATVQIHRIHAQSLTFSFFEGDNPIYGSINYSIPTIDEALRIIDVLNRYQYFTSLNHSFLSDSLKYEPIRIGYNCYWEGSTPYVHFNSDLFQLQVDERAIITDKGSVSFRKLFLRIESVEKEVLYFNIYLLTSLMDIVLLEKGSFRNERDISLPIDRYLNDICNNRYSAQLKILVSKDPIIVDFSQRGIQ